MKRIVILVVAAAFVFGAGLVVADQLSTDVDVVKLDLKRCSTSSDCPNSKCSSGKCGSCSTSSDCKFGKCSSGKCGSCSTSSDCGGWGKCSSGKCGSCSTSSDCGSFGSCSGGRCAKSPY